MTSHTDIASMLLARAGDTHPGLRTRDQTWTWDEVVSCSAARAALALGRKPSDAPFHIGVLLPNVPEFVFWLGGAALAGATVVGLNPTRGAQDLAADIRHADCAMVITDTAGAERLRSLDHGVDTDLIWCVDDSQYWHLVDEHRVAAAGAAPGVDEKTLLLLLFTSGTTGTSKAVRCTQGRLARIAYTATEKFGHHRGDVDYCCMPLFHGNALMALWAPALANGATVCFTPSFSASGFLADVRFFGATFFTYVGKALASTRRRCCCSCSPPERPGHRRLSDARRAGWPASPTRRRRNSVITAAMSTTAACRCSTATP